MPWCYRYYDASYSQYYVIAAMLDFAKCLRMIGAEFTRWILKCSWIYAIYFLGDFNESFRLLFFHAHLYRCANFR
jgi:hypothetical protein